LRVIDFREVIGEGRSLIVYSEMFVVGAGKFIFKSGDPRAEELVGKHSCLVKSSDATGESLQGESGLCLN
jgi:hypothetical protein